MIVEGICFIAITTQSQIKNVSNSEVPNLAGASRQFKMHIDNCWPAPKGRSTLSLCNSDTEEILDNLPFTLIVPILHRSQAHS